MEKRIKLHSTLKISHEKVKGRDSRKDLWSSIVQQQSSKEKALKIERKKNGKMNAKRRLSAIEVKKTSPTEAKKINPKKTNNIQLEKPESNHKNKTSDNDELFVKDIKNKKRIESKFMEKTSNFKSQIYDIDVRSELTDEETQTSKTEENNSKCGGGGDIKERRFRSIMDQGVVGEKNFTESFSLQGKMLSQLDSKKIKEMDRSGHFSFGDKPSQIIKSEYNENIKDVIFTMNWKKSGQYPPPTTSQITRQDLLKYDPLLLVYYYEKHIEFTQCPDFSADSELDRIPH